MLFKFEIYIQTLKHKILGLFTEVYLKLHGCKVGRGLKCYSFPNFRVLPQSNITIGNQVTIGRNVTLEITPSGSLTLSNHVLLADNILLSSMSKISLGEWSAIAENCSIRGSFHYLKKDINYRQQENFSEDITIGIDCGIGANSVVLWGSTIPNGTFIGASSLVTKHDDIKPNSVYSGNPVTFIKERT